MQNLESKEFGVDGGASGVVGGKDRVAALGKIVWIETQLSKIDAVGEQGRGRLGQLRIEYKSGSFYFK